MSRIRLDHQSISYSAFSLTDHRKEPTKVMISSIEYDENFFLQNRIVKDMKGKFELDAVCAIDLEGNIVQINPSCEAIIGYTVEQLSGTSLWSIVVPKSLEKVVSYFNEARVGKYQNFDCQFIHKSGNHIDLNIINLPIVLDGDIVGVYGVVKDITEIKQKRHQIREREVLYHLLTDHSLDLITKSNIHGEFNYVSPYCFDLLGYNPEELIGKSSHDFIHIDDLDRVLGSRSLVINHHCNGRVSYRMKHKAGYYVWVEALCKSIVKENSGEIRIISVIRDISDRKKTEEILLHSEKLAVAGQLAAGIVHEVRNPLTAIKGFLQLMDANKKYQHSYFQIIHSEIDRIELILSELLVLSKPKDMKFNKVDLSEILIQVKALIDTHANMNNIEIELNYISNIPTLICDENQLKQVFINFLKNAIEAMPQGGKIIVNLISEEPHTIKIQFIDQGSGIPKEYIDRIGQPFFTTKENGTGLGFMISMKIIENHQGEIQIESNESGTTIEVILPTSQ
jgi:two-component system, sporulation sensor kinase A